MTKTKVTIPREKLNTPMIPIIAKDQGLTPITLKTVEGPKLNPIQEKDPDISQMIAEIQVMLQMKIQPLPEETKEVTKRILILTLMTI